MNFKKNLARLIAVFSLFGINSLTFSASSPTNFTMYLAKTIVNERVLGGPIIYPGKQVTHIVEGSFNFYGSPSLSGTLYEIENIENNGSALSKNKICTFSIAQEELKRRDDVIISIGDQERLVIPLILDLYGSIPTCTNSDGDIIAEVIDAKIFDYYTDLTNQLFRSNPSGLIKFFESGDGNIIQIHDKSFFKKVTLEVNLENSAIEKKPNKIERNDDEMLIIPLRSKSIESKSDNQVIGNVFIRNTGKIIHTPEPIHQQLQYDNSSDMFNIRIKLNLSILQESLNLLEQYIAKHINIPFTSEMIKNNLDYFETKPIDFYNGICKVLKNNTQYIHAADHYITVLTSTNTKNKFNNVLQDLRNKQQGFINTLNEINKNCS